MSLKNQLYNMLSNEWIAGGTLEKRAWELGFKASNASRRLRELAKNGLIERKIERGFVWYRRISDLHALPEGQYVYLCE